MDKTWKKRQWNDGKLIITICHPALSPYGDSWQKKVRSFPLDIFSSEVLKVLVYCLDCLNDCVTHGHYTSVIRGQE